MKSAVHSVFALFFALFATQVLAQRPLALTVEAGLHTGHLDAANQARLGLQWGIHEAALEYGASYSETPTQHFGLRYRAFLPAAPSLHGVLPFVQAGASLSHMPQYIWGTGETVRTFNLDLASGLKVSVWKGLHLSGHVGLRYSMINALTNQFISLSFGPAIRPVGGVALGYTLPLRASAEPGATDLPQPAATSKRHEIGIAFSSATLANWFGYSEFRLHYAYRLRPHWDLRAAVDLPAWPIYYASTMSVSRFWQPGLALGARFWANPSTSFAVFADAGLVGVRRFLPMFSDFAVSQVRLEPELGTGVRACITPALAVELNAYLRAMPFRGLRNGFADNGVRLGVSYRFGAGRTPSTAMVD